MPIAVLHDATKCLGCGQCVKACAAHNNPGTVPGVTSTPTVLTPTSWTRIQTRYVDYKGKRLRVNTKIQCLHCLTPACAAACPVGALHKTEAGPVVYDQGKCFGCRYCIVACPFGIPTYEWANPIPWVRKCTLCADRVAAGKQPACVEACPTGALTFGEDRKALLLTAGLRMAHEPDRYVHHIYGEKELGGTSWLYISPVPFELLGFPAVGKGTVTTNVERAMGAVPPALLGVAAVMSGVYWVFKRKERLANASAGDDPGEQVKP
jgi:formate dehydrogenase iron-sulfur subunit